MGFSAVAAATVAAAGINAAASSSAADKAAKAAENGSTQTIVPWGGQQPYLTDSFKNAQELYTARKDTPYYTGNLYTSLNDTQKAGIDGIKGWVNGSGSTLTNSLTGQGINGANAGGRFLENATDFAKGDFGRVPGSQAGALSDFGSQVVGGYGDYMGKLDGVLSSAQADPTKANISSARDYMNSGALQEQIDAASADVNHTLGTNLVGLNNQASAGGNLNSSRAGAAEAAMKGEAARTIGSMSAKLRGDAYTRGLGLAEQARTTNLGTSLSALGQQGNTFGLGLNALGTAEQARQSEIGNRLNANTQLGQASELGMKATDLANTMGLGNAGATLQAGGVLQTDANNLNNANFQRWQGQDTRQSDLLKQYYEIVGSNGWGQTKTAQQPYTGPSSAMAGLQGGLGGATSALGLIGSFRNAFPSTFGSSSTPALYPTGGGGMATTPGWGGFTGAY